MHTRVKIKFKLKNLKTILEQLNVCKDDEAVVTHEFEIGLKKKALEFLVKSDEVIDWDIVEESATNHEPEDDPDVKRVIPVCNLEEEEREEVTIPVTPTQSTIPFEEPAVSAEPLRITPIVRKKSWAEKKEELKKRINIMYPEGMNGDDLLEILGYIGELKKYSEEDPILGDLTTNVIDKYVLDRMTGRLYEDTVAKQVKGLVTFVFELDDFLDRVYKNWDNIESASYVNVFETIYNTKVFGVER